MQLSCPTPNLDLDFVTLGHGSGGLLTHRLLNLGVFEILGDVLVNSEHDGACIDTGEKMAVSTDSFIVSPIFFPGGSIGDLAVNGTVNDVAMCGAIPRYLTLSLIIEEGLSVSELWRVVDDIAVACRKANVKIVTGDTKVVDRGSGDKIFINTTGIGSYIQGAKISPSRILPGDAIILSDSIANHGMAIMSKREGLEFESEITSDTRALNHSVKAILDEFTNQIHLITDPTRGGVATVVNEIAQKTSLGVELIYEKIPVEPQVAGACELLGLDPLYVANEGVFMVICPWDIKDGVEESLRHIGHQPAVIGRMVEEHQKKVIIDTPMGGKRVISMLPGSQLPRIC
ncbi:MAG: hydrogenase expression/formation protein HypE [Schleiferiaceae bacterium]